MEIAAIDGNSVQQSTTRGTWSQSDLTTVVDYFFDNRDSIVTTGKQIYTNAGQSLKITRSARSVRDKLISLIKATAFLGTYNESRGWVENPSHLPSREDQAFMSTVEANTKMSLLFKPYYGSPFPYYDKIVAINPFIEKIETHHKTSLIYVDPTTVCQASSSTTAIQSLTTPPSPFDPASEYAELTDLQQAMFLPPMPSSHPPPSVFQQGRMGPGPTSSDSPTLLLESSEFPSESETYALGDNYESHPFLSHASSLYIPSSSSQTHPTIQASYDLSRHPSSRTSPFSGSPLSGSLRSHPYLEASSLRSSRRSSLLHEVAGDANLPNPSPTQVDELQVIQIQKISRALEAIDLSSVQKAELLDYFCENPKRAAAVPEEETFRQAYFLKCLGKISPPDR